MKNKIKYTHEPIEARIITDFLSKPEDLVPMKTEIEAKFTDINSEEIRKKLLQTGAICVYEERLMKRKNFDFPDHRFDEIRAWVRVRNEGEIVTLSYKQLNDRTLHGTKEVDVEVNDFDKTCQFLEAIGMKNYSYQETKREKWELDGVEIVIDTWPWIPTFLEIEGSDEKSVRQVATELGLDWNKALHGSVEIVYRQHYVATDEEVDAWKEITFIPIPDWLEAKRKQ